MRVIAGGKKGPLITQITTDYAYLSLISLSLSILIYLSIYSYLSIYPHLSPIHPVSIRHRPRQAEYRHAGGIARPQGSPCMARTAAA
jgi:hypothetical protein